VDSDSWLIDIALTGSINSRLLFRQSETHGKFMVRDIVVIGGSAGSPAVIKQILRELPANFPAKIFIVNHIGASGNLQRVYEAVSRIPVRTATSGELAQPGHAYVAAADAHLLLHDDHLLVRRGPRENFCRPAIDPLFRSAAVAGGGRVIAVLLSGNLNDGAAGLVAIKRCGGLVVVQDPADAEVPSMPDAALHAVIADYCVSGAEMPALLTKLVGSPVGEIRAIPPDIELEVAIAACEPATMTMENTLGEKSPFSCPDCDGVLWQVHDEGVLRFRCHVGHSTTAAAMLEAKTASADALLWRLLRVHEERAALSRKMAFEAQRRHPASANAYSQKAVGYEEDASTIRRLLTEIPRGQDS